MPSTVTPTYRGTHCFGTCRIKGATITSDNCTTHFHVPAVSNCTNTDEEKRCPQKLVKNSPGIRKMGFRESGENLSRVWNRTKLSTVMLVPVANMNLFTLYLLKCSLWRLTKPEHPNRHRRPHMRLKMIQGTELPDSEEPVHDDIIYSDIHLQPTFHQGNFPTVATATVTAGLIWPPDTPPLTTKPSIVPIPHLGRTWSQR